MAETSSHYIDVERYNQLPPDVRFAFDAWLNREGLWSNDIVEFTLLEGAIKATVHVIHEGALVLAPDGENVLTETVIIPVSSAPPREALT